MKYVMKSFVIYFLAQFFVIWAYRQFPFFGVMVANQFVVFILALILSSGLIVAEKIREKLRINGMLSIIIIGSLFNSLVLIVGPYFIPGLHTSRRLLSFVGLGHLDTAALEFGDRVLTVLFAALLSVCVAYFLRLAISGFASNKANLKANHSRIPGSSKEKENDT